MFKLKMKKNKILTFRQALELPEGALVRVAGCTHSPRSSNIGKVLVRVKEGGSIKHRYSKTTTFLSLSNDRSNRYSGWWGSGLEGNTFELLEHMTEEDYFKDK